MATGAQAWSVAPVTQDTWHDLEALFEGKGGPKYCWCMAWRPIEGRTTADNAARKRALHASVSSDVPVGLIGYIGGEPVAWCSVAPRETFVRLSERQEDEEAGVWSVTCFFVRRDHRKTGLSAKLLDAAIERTKSSGAKVLEAYPVDPDSPSYRFMGFVGLFESRGFREIGKAGSRRHVMRRTL